MKKRTLELDDFLRIEYLSSPALSPDGTRALYCVSRGDPDTGRFTQKIWSTDTAAPAPAPLFSGNFQQKLPRFSPDGTAVYFLSDEGNPEVFQIWRQKNGTREKLTTLRHGVTWFSLSPDGRFLAFEAPLWLEGTGVNDRRENAFEELSGSALEDWKHRKERQPIVIEELMYKFDETYGIPDGSISQLGYADLSSSRVHLLTWENVQHHRPVFSPDGSSVACWRLPYSGWQKRQSELTVYNLAGEMTQLTTNSFSLGETPLWLDNSSILYSAFCEKDYMHSVLYKVGSPDTPPVNLMPEQSRSWGPGALLTGHTACGYPGDNLYLLGDSVLYLGLDHGVSGIYEIYPVHSGDGSNGQTAERILTPDKCCIQGFSAAAGIPCASGASGTGKEEDGNRGNPGKYLYIKGTPDHIGDLYFLDEAAGEERLLSRHNRWMEEVELPCPQELNVPSPDGVSTVHGWVLKPADYQEGALYPAVLDIHGGPECCYPFDWWFEFQYLAARGMAVVWCDPHGSISYGKDFQKGAWEDIAYEDLMAFLDAAVSLGYIDENRCGVTGGSYGGYMTNHIIGRTSRFAAAVSQRNLCNRATSYGTGDMGSIFDGPFRGCLQSLINRMKGGSSTITSIDRIDTPLLILHATSDYRCSFEQGEQMFIALKDRRPEVPVRFAAFPGENHGLTREGNMYAQRGHLLEMADWFCKYLSKNKDSISGEEHSTSEQSRRFQQEEVTK